MRIQILLHRCDIYTCVKYEDKVENLTHAMLCCAMLCRARPCRVIKSCHASPRHQKKERKKERKRIVQKRERGE